MTNEHIDRHDRTGAWASAKTACATAVIRSLGIADSAFHSTATRRTTDAYEGVIRRNGFALRSRKSAAGKGTVGAIRTKLSGLGDPKGTVYLVRVKGHVLLLDGAGNTICDTDPRKRDRRQVVKIHAIWRK